MNRGIVALLCYLGIVFLGAAAISPWLYLGLNSFAHSHPWVEALASKPFHRYVSRSLMILALLGLYPLAKTLGFNRPSEFGWARRGRSLGLWTRGFVTGLATLGTLAALSIIFGGQEVTKLPGASRMVALVLSASLAALLVALAEETLFRGFLFGALRRHLGVVGSALLSSSVYALVHFFRRVEAPTEIHWDSGFIVLSQMLSGFADAQSLVPAFLNLTLAGLLLAFFTWKTGSLYFSAGMHAGWVFWIKVFGAIATPVTFGNIRFWGSNKIIDGWAGGVLLALLLAVVVIRGQGADESSQGSHRD